MIEIRFGRFLFFFILIFRFAISTCSVGFGASCFIHLICSKCICDSIKTNTFFFANKLLSISCKLINDLLMEYKWTYTFSSILYSVELNISSISIHWPFSFTLFSIEQNRHQDENKSTNDDASNINSIVDDLRLCHLVFIIGLLAM